MRSMVAREEKPELAAKGVEEYDYVVGAGALPRLCGAAPQERRIALSTLRSGYPSACGDTLGREKGRRGLALRPFAF
jgi:hypothetical protein